MADCERCARPVYDTGYICSRCQVGLSVTLLRAAQLADEVTTTIARLDRIERGVGRARMPEREAWARNPNALYPTTMPVRYDATLDARAVINTLVTWTRHIADERGAALPDNRVVAMACWLAGQTRWLRMRPEAGEAFDELHDAARMIRVIVDSPAARALAGQCDCGAHLYAIAGRPVVTCEQCGEAWEVEAMRTHLRVLLDGRLFTAAELGTLAVILGVADDRHRVRKRINKWASRDEIVSYGEYPASTFRFDEVIARLTAG